MPLHNLLLLFFLLVPSHSAAHASPPCPELSPWLSQLTVEERIQASSELALAEKDLNVLRQKLRKKLAELRLLRYDRQSSPEMLPRLGRELIELRELLHDEHQALQRRLCERFGSMPSLEELQNLLHGQVPKN